MKNINPLGLFDDQFLNQKLNKLGNPLEKLDRYIDWMIFEQIVNQPFEKEQGEKGQGGRPAFNRLMLFKAFVIQALYNLSEEQLEYQILDRTSFKVFLGFKKSDRVPDSRTFWHFREQLIAFGCIESLFEAFNTQLDKSGVFANEGKRVDASFVEVPRQRNNREENKPLTEGQKTSNREKSRVRARVEHIFGFVENSMNGLYQNSEDGKGRGKNRNDEHRVQNM